MPRGIYIRKSKKASLPATTSPLQGNQRGQTEATFTSALEAANRRLAQAIQERAEAQSKLAYLAGEIPSLQDTIRALSNNLRPATVVPPQSGIAVVANGNWVGIVKPPLSTDPIERLRQQVFKDGPEDE